MGKTPAIAEAVIFDLDGTLLDTLADIGDAVNTMLAENGFPQHRADDYRRFIGNGIKMLVTRALPANQRTETTVLACVERARAIYWQNWDRKTCPYDGIVPLLDRLEARSIAKAVLSNKPQAFTVRYIEAFFPNTTFQQVMGQNDRFPLKPDPSAALEIARRIGLPPSAFLFVGDSIVDVQTAVSAGMHAVGVSWGFKGPQDLVRQGCPVVVDHPMQILSLLATGRSPSAQ